MQSLNGAAAAVAALAGIALAAMILPTPATRGSRAANIS